MKKKAGMHAFRKFVGTVLVATAIVCLTHVSFLHAQAVNMEAIAREVTALEGETRALASEPVDVRERQSPTHVEERLADGELFFRLHDYVRASIIFTDIVDNYPRHAAYADALFLLGDSLFRAGDHLGARTRFQEIIRRSSEAPFVPYVQQSLGRLIEVAIHTRDWTGIEELFERLNALPPSEIQAGTNYFRAKYLYNRAVRTEEILATQDAMRLHVDVDGLTQAAAVFELVPRDSSYYPQSRYFLGVIHTLKEEYPEAIGEFARVLNSDATTTETAEAGGDVVELAHLALGRLYYETDQLEQAVEAYQAIPRTSGQFDVALYEVAWAYIRLGDAVRAERALEVLTIAAPDSRFIPDGKLLRGNLLLRNGRYDEANTVFREVAQEFGPVRRELDQMMSDHAAAGMEYFKGLVRDNMETFDANAFLPPLAQRWASMEGEMDRAVAVLADLAQCRRLVRETDQLVQRLSAAMNQSNRAAVFADLRSQRERSTSLRNRVARVRRQLAAGDTSGGSSELVEVRTRRMEIERFINDMPTDEDDFDAMDQVVLDRFRTLERELGRMEVELMGMEARMTATTQFMAQSTGQRDASGDEAVQAEMQSHRTSIEAYRTEISEIRIQLEAARLQVGVGDDRYTRLDQLRAEYTQLIEHERSLGGLRSTPEQDRIFARLTGVDRQLDSHDAAIARAVATRSEEIMRQVNEEQARLTGYQTALAELAGETENVVGAITYNNFQRVQRRFYDLVLRADVGRVDVAWSQREEHRRRVEMLTTERSREIRGLDDEFREINDEVGPASSGGGDAPSGDGAPAGDSAPAATGGAQ